MKPMRISWSGLQRYENCHHKHLQVTRGRSLPKMGRVYLPGNVCDLAMRRWLSQDEPPPGQMAEMVPGILRELTEPRTEEERSSRDFRVIQWKGDPARDRARVEEFCLEVVGTLEPLLQRLVLPYEWQADLRFEAPVGIPAPDGRQGSILLIGACDVVVRDDDGFAVYDLKTTVKERYLHKTLGQGVFYDVAIGHWAGDTSQPRKMAFLAPALREPITWVQVGDEDRRVLMARVISMAEGIWAEDWRPKLDDDGCAVCQVRHVCEKFSVVASRDKVGRNVADFVGTANHRSAVQLEDKSLR